MCNQVIYNSSFDFKVYLGFNFTSDNPSRAHYYESNEAYIHPKYARIRPSISVSTYDLALIKINKPISSTRGVNSICLPEKSRAPSGSATAAHKRQYVMIAGWGGPFQQGGINRLRMAAWRLADKDIIDPNVKIYKIEKQGSCGVSVSQIKLYLDSAIYYSIYLCTPPQTIKYLCTISN